jgi:hypothetical protein
VTVLAEKHLSTFVYVMFAGADRRVLSTVDSCLLAAASLVSQHHRAARTGLSERARSGARAAASFRSACSHT